MWCHIGGTPWLRPGTDTMIGWFSWSTWYRRCDWMIFLKHLVQTLWLDDFPKRTWYRRCDWMTFLKHLVQTLWLDDFQIAALTSTYVFALLQYCRDHTELITGKLALKNFVLSMATKNNFLAVNLPGAVGTPTGLCMIHLSPLFGKRNYMEITVVNCQTKRMFTFILTSFFIGAVPKYLHA